MLYQICLRFMNRRRFLCFVLLAAVFLLVVNVFHVTITMRPSKAVFVENAQKFQVENTQQLFQRFLSEDKSYPQTKIDSEVTSRTYPQTKSDSEVKSRTANIACQLPQLDPFHPKMMKHISKPRPLRCVGVAGLGFKLNITAEHNKIRIQGPDIKKAGYRIIQRTPGSDFRVSMGEEIGITLNKSEQGKHM